MKTFTKIPSHYRQLKPHELVRNDDLWRSLSGETSGRILDPIKGLTAKKLSDSWTYWRRCHVSVKQQMEKKKANPIEKAPLVSFMYPSKNPGDYPEQRTVRVVAANHTYLAGLDVNDGFKYKKFLRLKMRLLELIEFNSSVLA